MGGLPTGNSPVGFLRIVILGGLFPCHLGVSAENLSKLVKRFRSIPNLFLAGDLKLRLRDGEEELNAVSSRIQHDFGLAFLPIFLGLLEMDLALVLDLVIPQFLHRPVGV